MSAILPRLRLNLDYMPSPVAERPGLLIRDPYHYSDVTLIIPPALLPCLECFDGEQTELDLKQMLVQLTGELDVSQLQNHLYQTLDQAGFLENETYEQVKAQAQQAFAEAPERLASLAGSAYPADPGELREVFTSYLEGGQEPAKRRVLGIAAPHVSPFGGVESYRAAYRALSPEDADRTFVILGTSHYGEPDRFGLTRKPFLTPYGVAETDERIVGELAAVEDAVRMEDFCHAVEHSIEFQVVFLQHLFGPKVRIVPILCGSFARSLYVGGMPEDLAHNARFFDLLGNIAAREGNRLCWVLGVDMAHMGQRYGDSFAAEAGRGEMQQVAERDQKRIASLNAGKEDEFWDQVRVNRDDLKWCGSAPIYTFLKAVPQARGELLQYQQWNIDEASVVSFAGIRFDS